MLCDKARLNFSEFSLAMNASLAFCIACTFLLIILLVGVDVNAGALVLWIEVGLGLLVGMEKTHGCWLMSFWRLLTKGQLILGHNYFLLRFC